MICASAFNQTTRDFNETMGIVINKGDLYSVLALQFHMAFSLHKSIKVFLITYFKQL